MITCQFENGNPSSLRHVVADVLLIKRNDILLVKRAPGLVEGGKWGIVGGFVERDETIEQAARREVFEETGYRVGDLRLLTVRDDPGRSGEDRQNIAFIFIGNALEQEGAPDDESTEQRWFPLDALPREEEIAFDHYQSIALYLNDSSLKHTRVIQEPF